MELSGLVEEMDSNLAELFDGGKYLCFLSIDDSGIQFDCYHIKSYQRTCLFVYVFISSFNQD